MALNGIHKSMINKFENGTMTIHVDATIYDCDYKPIAGTFYLYFKKYKTRIKNYKCYY